MKTIELKNDTGRSKKEWVHKYVPGVQNKTWAWPQPVHDAKGIDFYFEPVI